jgi:hypothetical protein
MATLIDGLNLKLDDILNGKHTDIHGHEIIFEKTGHLEFSSVYDINCNRKFTINLSSVIVTVKETIISDRDTVYNDIPNINGKAEYQKPNITISKRPTKIGYENYA